MLFEREGLPVLPYESAQRLIGSGSGGTIADGMDANGRIVAPAELDRSFADFIAHYVEHLTARSPLFRGVVDALDQLVGAGCRFAVCTNKLKRRSLLLLEALKLADRFAAICGQDTFGVQKPTRRCCAAPLRRLAAILNAL